MDNGIILIDKPSGMTSFGVVARLRRVLTQAKGKKIKVGHTGTLDPFATGLMIVVVGKECKNAGRYSKLDKTYKATIRLGQTSSSGDPEGEIVDFSDNKPAKEAVGRALNKFVGQISQKPPVFSAIKINGRRAYDIARDGKIVDMPVRRVNIYNIKLLDYNYPFIKITASVSSGTYIRSLAEDIGKELGTGAYCTELRRISVGEYDIKQAKTLSDFGIND